MWVEYPAILFFFAEFLFLRMNGHVDIHDCIASHYSRPIGFGTQFALNHVALLQKYENAAAGAPNIVKQGEEPADFWRLLNSGVSLIGKPPAAASAAAAMASQVHSCAWDDNSINQNILKEAMHVVHNDEKQHSTNYQSLKQPLSSPPTAFRRIRFENLQYLLCFSIKVRHVISQRPSFLFFHSSLVPFVCVCVCAHHGSRS